MAAPCFSKRTSLSAFEVFSTVLARPVLIFFYFLRRFALCATHLIEFGRMATKFGAGSAALLNRVMPKVGKFIHVPSCGVDELSAGVFLNSIFSVSLLPCAFSG